MVSAWWLLLAFFVGGYAGFLLLAMLTISRESDAKCERAHHGSPREAARPPRADPAVDWVI